MIYGKTQFFIKTIYGKTLIIFITYEETDPDKVINEISSQIDQSDIGSVYSPVDFSIVCCGKNLLDISEEIKGGIGLYLSKINPPYIIFKLKNE